MAINLQYAIDFASGQPSFATVVVSMHDAAGVALFGFANPTFRDDVPLVYGTTSIGQLPDRQAIGDTGVLHARRPASATASFQRAPAKRRDDRDWCAAAALRSKQAGPDGILGTPESGVSRYLPPPFGPSVQIEIARSPQLVARWFMQLASTRPRTRPIACCRLQRPKSDSERLVHGHADRSVTYRRLESVSEVLP